MLSEDVEELFNDLSKLSNDKRDEVERALICILVEELNKIDLSSEDWREIVSYSRELIAEKRKGCLYQLIVERAPTKKQANDFAENFLAENLIQEAIKNRKIWQNIIEHEKCHHLVNTSQTTSHQRWQTLAKIINPAKQRPRAGTGKSIDPFFWREAYNFGKYAAVDEKWFEVWEKSKTKLSFVNWCLAVGIENNAIAYYNQQERSSLIINFKDGKLVDLSDGLLHTMKERGNNLTNRVVDCVMALDETLYCYGTSNQFEKEGEARHSGILSGQPVLFAGEIGVKNGKLTLITMQSGHYLPTVENLIEFLTVLHRNGIDLSEVTLIDGKGSIVLENALEFLSLFQDKRNRPS